MSSLPVHRQRDRGGGSGSVVAAKPLTPKSVSSKISQPVLKKSSSGKENPKPVLTRSQKPTIKSVPRIEKAAGENGDSRVRSSTSSVPRGRSQSPSEFFRVFSDVKKDRLSRVSAVEKKGPRDSNVKSSNEKKGCSDLKAKNGVGLNLEKKSGNERNSNGVKILGNNSYKGINLSSTSGKSSLVSVNGKFETCNEMGCSDLGLKVENGVKVTILKSDDKTEKSGVCVDVGSNEKSLSDLKVLKEKGYSEEGVSTRTGVKYPSKLHEKLTFLEGKVKRIASDIKRTKEMLDMNNPDASKVILSDIQEKISGIEKAMGNVVGDSEGKVGGLKSVGNDDGGSKVAQGSKGKQVDCLKSSVKGLKNDELEARLFPHQKLLRNRMTTKTSSGSSQTHEPDVVVPNSDLKAEKLLNPLDESPIELEFLASLDKDLPKVTTREGQVDMECCEVEETDQAANSGEQGLSNMFNGKSDAGVSLTTNERLDDFDDQENKQDLIIGEETEDSSIYQLNEIGQRTSTGGWFVSEGESVLLAHDDGSCSYYDIANCEDKAVYKPPVEVSPTIWRDCWIIRAPSADGCSGRYVVAASAGNTMESGFCSWDFYTKDVQAFHIEDGGTNTSRTVLGPLPNNMYRRNAFSSVLAPETRQWWYKPCGPLIISTASSQRVVKIHDIRDGEQIMSWEVQKPVLTMDYSSPLQWRNRGKIVIAEAETISLWDVNSLNPQALQSVSSSGRKISALHVNNTDAELGGGVRQRVTSAEAEGNDGVFCTSDSINVLDFRHPSGVGVRIPKLGINVQSVFSRGDSVFLGCANVRSAGKKQPTPQVQQFSLRKQRPFANYTLPESNAHSHYTAITQVWGNSNLVMAVSGLGLSVFDALKDGLQSFTSDHSSSSQNVREVIGPDDLYAPSFDYLASRALLISRDRPALWRHLP